MSDNAASNPTDITVRWNLMTKPLSWKSQSYDVNNIFQLKNAQRVLLEGNVLEYVWADQQAGNAIVFTIRSEGAYSSPTSILALCPSIEHLNSADYVTISHSQMALCPGQSYKMLPCATTSSATHAPASVSRLPMAAPLRDRRSTRSGLSAFSSKTTSFTTSIIRYALVFSVWRTLPLSLSLTRAQTWCTYPDGTTQEDWRGGRGLSYTGGSAVPEAVTYDLALNHNNMFGTGPFVMSAFNTDKADRFTFTNNIVPRAAGCGQCGFAGSGTGEGLAALSAYFNPNYLFTNNGIMTAQVPFPSLSRHSLIVVTPCVIDLTITPASPT